MPCTIFRLPRGVQTGKTTLLQGALAQVRLIGGTTLYVVETMEHAQWLRQRRKEPYVASLLQAESLPTFAPYSAVAFDCAREPAPEMLDRVVRDLSTWPYPTQVLIAVNE